jgi:BASS family bile acid:Na+ symporter
VTLVIALVLNGFALAAGTPLRAFFAPLREARLIVSILALDLIVVPAVAIGLALVLDLDAVTRTALVIVVAASCGPVGIALSRAARADIPLAVSTVVGLGALNLVTVPLVTGLLLPDSVMLPPATLAWSLLVLVIAPLVTGRVLDAISVRVRMRPERRAQALTIIGRGADLALAGAMGVAVLLDPRTTLEVLLGPVTLIGLAVMGTVTLAARTITPDPARRRTIAITVNARAVGLALTITALYLGDVPGLRATVLAYGGLTQVVPLLVILLTRRFRRHTPEESVAG